jgi:hypothetical protein
MGPRDVGSRRLVGLASLALLAGCAAGASPTPTSVPSVAVATPTSRPAATATTAPTPTPTAIAYGPVSVVSGIENCDLSEDAHPASGGPFTRPARHVRMVSAPPGAKPQCLSPSRGSDLLAEASHA